MSGVKQLGADDLGREALRGNRGLVGAGLAEAMAPASRRGRPQPSRSRLAGAETAAEGTTGDALPGFWPKLTVCRDFSLQTVSAVLRRRLQPHCRVLLRLDGVPAELRLVHRVVLGGVDAVLVDTEATASAVQALGVPASRIVLRSASDDLSAFARPRRAWADDDPRRILHVGELEPEAGVADLLPCVAAWARRSPNRPVEIWWSGEGCLRGVLEAQPLPPNLKQRFLGRTPRLELPALFADCHVLAVPVLAECWADLVPEALAAQLPVLGSNRSRAAVELVAHGVTGWVFDPFEAGAMARTVSLALDASRDELERMGAGAPLQTGPAPLDERTWRTVRLEGSGSPASTPSLGVP